MRKMMMWVAGAMLLLLIIDGPIGEGRSDTKQRKDPGQHKHFQLWCADRMVIESQDEPEIASGGYYRVGLQTYTPLRGDMCGVKEVWK